MLTNALKLQTARQVLSEHGDSAWLLTADHAHSQVAAGPVIYVCDVRSGRVLLLPTAPGALQMLADQSGLDEPGYHEVRTATSILIGDVIDSVGRMHPATRQGLIMGAAFCVTQTRGFHLTKHHGADVQYLLVRYPDGTSGNHVLVPMPLFKADPIATQELEASVSHVLASEHVGHADRFTGARSLQFSQSRCSVVSRGVAS